MHAQSASTEFNAARTASHQRIQDKIAAGKPLVVHTLVALCDNEHQGIIPVNEQLGDGMNLRSNLYWGALYGVRNHIGRASAWKLVAVTKAENKMVLERRVFVRQYPGGPQVYLVADAYRGDAMQACLVAFFDAVAGRKTEVIEAGERKLEAFGGADLIVFNGHNGLMDYPDLRFLRSADQRSREVAAIGCISKDYFNLHLKSAGGYPLLMTTNLMAPEAYVLEALIDGWALGQDGEAIRQRVGAAYHQYQKCGVRGATRLFSSGW